MNALEPESRSRASSVAVARLSSDGSWRALRGASCGRLVGQRCIAEGVPAAIFSSAPFRDSRARMARASHDERSRALTRCGPWAGAPQEPAAVIASQPLRRNTRLLHWLPITARMILTRLILQGVFLPGRRHLAKRQRCGVCLCRLYVRSLTVRRRRRLEKAFTQK